jgi:hypothetical protein
MSIKLSLKQLLSIVFDDEGNNLYPECYLMNGSQVAYTVRLFSGRGNVWYGYTTPEAEFRENWLVTDITLENGKLFANSYQRV